MKITYLFGAGSSANCIPTSKTLHLKMRAFVEEVISTHKNLPTPGQGVSQQDFEAATTRMIAETKVLLEELEEYPNVDVYGKQLYLTSEATKSRQLKALVSGFLILHQLENRPDTRYDQFAANILEKNVEVILPMELLLLSWNYDFQLELAMANYFRQTQLDKLQEILNFYPRTSLQDLEREMLNKFSVIKLNGTVGGVLPDEGSYFPLPIPVKADKTLSKEEQHKMRLSEAILHYHTCSQPGSLAASDIMYAWEATPIQKRMRAYLKYKSYNTDVLVINGYSFPTFNRRLDREMLANMQLLKEACIQAPEEDIQAIHDRFVALLGTERVMGVGKSANPVRIRLVSMKKERPDEEFYVPYQATSF